MILKKSRSGDRYYRLLFENMLNGYAYCKMLLDKDGNPDDFIYIEVNRAFESLTGLKGVVGKRVTEVIPDIKRANPEVFTIYGRVATTGKPEKFELDLKPLSMWLSISVYCPEKGYFVAVFDNITEGKKREHDLQQKLTELEKFNKLTVDRELKMIEMKKKIEELEKIIKENSSK